MHASVLFSILLLARSQTGPAVTLPQGVTAQWDLAKAQRESTPTRERICINGLWRWQPARGDLSKPPTGEWGYFKVPGCWPGITDYMQKDCQTVFKHPSWSATNLVSIKSAWYEREVTIPSNWKGRAIRLRLEYLNSFATVFVDGKKASEIRFPGGEAVITSLCRPGEKHLLSLLVDAMPLKGVMLSYVDTNSAKEVKGTVERRGLCGDAYLESTPTGPRIDDVAVSTSVRNGEITVRSVLGSLSPSSLSLYRLRAVIRRSGKVVKEFDGKPFTSSITGTYELKEKWLPDALWDLNTPGNVYFLDLSLLDSGGKVLDTALPQQFGFREFRIQGRDFYLNGSRIFLSAVPLDNAQIGPYWASYKAAKESLERLKSIGINFVYTHNYGCEPGSHLSFEEILRAADDVGMLVALSQPHFSHYDWNNPDNGYAKHAAFYVNVAGSHPSVIMYSMSHNATGYSEDMNPDMIDGIHDDRDQWAKRNADQALRAEAIVKSLDPDRIVYHHAGGNIGAMHTSNFYPNWVPIQELSDWFAHWATEGVKPVFLCEYGAPFTWDWTMYRGWYKGKREWGSAQVPWEYCLAEWNAQFLGDRAYKIQEEEKRNLRWEAAKFRSGETWHRWDYPNQVGSKVFEDEHEVIARYTTDNWRAYRTWGVSGISPWEHEHFWKLKPGVNRSRATLPVDWDNLQRPGFSADYLDERYERMDLTYNRDDWIPTADGQAILRNNQPLLAYIAGKPAAFTSKDHNFLPGETIEKQLIIINNSRRTVACRYRYQPDWSTTFAFEGSATIPTGEQRKIPIRIIPQTPGEHMIRVTFEFDNGTVQKDEFRFHIMPPLRPTAAPSRVALYDPVGETLAVLKRFRVGFVRVPATANLSNYDLLIIGKGALTPSEPGPDISRVRSGMKVIMFEQTAEALEKRLGFRVQEYGLRQVFKRVANHPLLDGIATENLSDWRGEATLLSPRLKYTMRPMYGPTVQWCGMDAVRAWRCGCRGNVASVLIEKPGKGDFLPILDGGFSLQYSPLMEYHEGAGMVLFCQMDVTGRTESDPAADQLVRNIFQYVRNWKRGPHRSLVYSGEPAGKQYLESIGIHPGPAEPGADSVLIVGPEGERDANRFLNDVRYRSHVKVLGIGLSGAEMPNLLFSTRTGEHINAYFDPFSANSVLAGVGPADVYLREPRKLPLVWEGSVNPVGDGVLATSKRSSDALCQIVPWQVDPKLGSNVKRTYRRASFAITRILANMGVSATTPLLERIKNPAGNSEKRWTEGFYLDQPEEWDDPYRFFRW